MKRLCGLGLAAALRPGVTFQNGDKFTADDVAFGIALYGLSLSTSRDAAIVRMDDKREEGLRQAMLESLDQVPFIPLYNQTTVVATRKGIVYKPRMDEQIVPQNASPAQGATK